MQVHPTIISFDTLLSWKGKRLNPNVLVRISFKFRINIFIFMHFSSDFTIFKPLNISSNEDENNPMRTVKINWEWSESFWIFVPNTRLPLKRKPNGKGWTPCIKNVLKVRKLLILNLKNLPQFWKTSSLSHWRTFTLPKVGILF